MKPSRHIASSALLVLSALVAVSGVIGLFTMRFRHGDIYPPYSSLRSDPLGTRIYYESLQRSGLAETTRNFRQLDRADLPTDATLLMLGDHAFGGRPGPWSTATGNRLFGFIENGGRLVVTFRPQHGFDDQASDWEEDEGEEPDGEGTDDGSQETADEDSETTQDVQDWLQIGYGRDPVSEEGISAQRVASIDGAWLPDTIECHTDLFFTNLAPAWVTLYAREGKPVMVTRSLGSGSVVLSAVSFMVSNEALRDVPLPAFLLWLAGPGRTVIFDETHHGIGNAENVADLVRRYRLDRTAFFAVLLAMLFIWRNAVPVVPHGGVSPREGRDEVAVSSGFASGLTHILRRCLSKDALLHRCLVEWRSSRREEPGATESSAGEMDALIRRDGSGPEEETGPVEIYNTVCRKLAAERRGQGEQT